MEKTRTFLTGSEPSKDWHSQRCLCSWDFMRGIVDKFDRNTDWAKGQRTLSATEAKIRNYWKSCDHRLPLFPAADPDPKAHSETLASFFWGRWEQKRSDAGPQNPLLLLDRDGGWSLAEAWTHPDRNFWRLDLQDAGTAVSFISF